MAYDFESSSTQWMHYGSILDSVFGGADKKFSFLVSFRMESLPTDPALIARYDFDLGGQRQFILIIEQATSQLYFAYYGDGAAVKRALVRFTTTTLSIGTDYHVVVVYDGSVDSAAVDRLSCWINGTAQAKSLITAVGFPFNIWSGSTARLSVGAYNTVGTPGGLFDGVIWEPAVASGLLVADDASAYAAGYVPEMIRPDLLEWCPRLIRSTHDPYSGASATLSASAPTVVEHPRVIEAGERRLMLPAAHVGGLVDGPRLRSKLRGLAA